MRSPKPAGSKNRCSKTARFVLTKLGILYFEVYEDLKNPDKKIFYWEGDEYNEAGKWVVNVKTGDKHYTFSHEDFKEYFFKIRTTSSKRKKTGEKP